MKTAAVRAATGAKVGSMAWNFSDRYDGNDRDDRDGEKRRLVLRGGRGRKNGGKRKRKGVAGRGGRRVESGHEDE